MSENIRKSLIEEAKSDYEQIKQFALEGAKKGLEKEIDEKVKDIIENILNEEVSVQMGDVSINVDSKDESEVTIKKDGNTVTLSSDEEESEEEPVMVDSDEEEMEDEMEDESEVEDEMDSEGEDEMIDIEDEGDFDMGDDEEIEIDEDIYMEQEAPVEQPAPAPAPAPAQTPAPAPTPEVEQAEGESVSEELSDISSKLDMLINMLQGEESEGSEEEGEIEIIDDTSETETAPAAPAQGAQQAPVMQEFELEEGDDDFVFESDEEMFDLEDDMMNEMNIEFDDEDEEIEETRALSSASKHSGDRNYKMSSMEKHSGHHSPVTSLNESVDKIKAQYESKVDELLKENESLRSEVEDFQESFIELRKQFNEMQTFNAKLAFVNKLLMNGGINNEEKVRIAERFDEVSTIEEAEKLYKNIVREGVSGVSKQPLTSKLKSSTTNVVKSTASPLYESAEVKRMKFLCGIEKNEE